MSAETIKIASWNICDGLTNPDAMPAVVERIKGLEADIVALPEAFNEAADTGDAGKAALLEEALSSFEAEGYRVRSVLYNDTDGRKDRHGFTMLNRESESEMHVVDLGNRRVLGAYVGGLSLHVVGVHLDDRAEVTRLEQASNLVGSLDEDDHNVLMGDFNAMHHHDIRARLLRMTGPTVRLLPSVDPGEQAPNLAKLRRIGSLSQRLAGMATGSALQYLHDVGYRDVDEQLRPTKGPVQLDHILTNFDELHRGHYLNVGDYRVDESSAGESDHRPISAVVSY